MKKLIFFLLLFSVFCSAEIISSYVVDNAGVFDDSTKSSLEQNLRDFETQTNGVQFVVFTEKFIPEGSSLEERSLKIAEDNKIGKKGNDNGILFYLATEDRQYRWEVGYGVESTLNAARLGRISREIMVPYFKEGNFQEGVLSGVKVVESVVLNSSDADLIISSSSESVELPPKVIIFLIILAFFIIFNIFRLVMWSKVRRVKKKDDDFFIAVASGLLFGGRGSGGGFGGFSGGGGSFGGGGFSGRF